jgi:outer membrane protein
MKHKIITVITAVVLSGIQEGIAQQVRYLPVDEAVQLAVKNSGQLKLDKAKVDEAVANYKDVWNNHLPDVKVSAAYLRLNNPNIDLKLKLGSSSDTTKKSSGGSIKVDQAAYGIVSASLPLFSGLRIKYGVEAAKYLAQAAKLDADNDIEDVVMNALNAYSNLFKAKKAVDLVEENLKQQKQRVADFSNLEKNGLLARNDLLKAQLQQSNIELALLDAQNQLGLTYEAMDLLLGLPEGTEILPDTTVKYEAQDAGTISQWEQTALQNRKDLASVTVKEKAATASIKSVKGEYYPGIALTGGYIAADVPNVLTLTNALNIGVGLQYNIGALWKTGAKVAQAKARLQQLDAAQGLMSDQIRLQVNQNYRNYIVNVQKIDVYAKSVAQADENYRITKNKYDNNLVTTTDLLEADVAQLQANLSLMLSKVDAIIAYKKLQQTAGTLASSYHAAK